jgi:large subunit ribosomal protein L10
MNRDEKAQVIEELAEKFKENPFFYITDASGMSVAQVNQFRRMCFEKNIEYRVVKNKLIAKALEKQDTDYSIFSEKVLKGFSGILFEKETGNAPAKLLREFRKKQSSEKPLLKAASIDSDIFIGEENLKLLSDLKSKNELIGDVIALLQSPAKNVISALQSGGNTVAGLVKALEERAA